MAFVPGKAAHGTFELFVLPRLPGAAPWTRCGGANGLPTSIERHGGLFPTVVVTPVFISAALASVIVAALFYALALQREPQMLAAEAGANGAVVVLGINATTRATGAGTVVAVSGDRIRILTAKHVAVFGGLSVRFDGRTTVSARIVTMVAGRDLAVLEAIVPPQLASGLHAARIGAARPDERVTIAGSDPDGHLDTEAGAVSQVGGVLPDGPANGRFALRCALCHIGDSGAGVFNAAGDLIGVYVGYWTYDNGERVSVAELPAGGT